MSLVPLHTHSMYSALDGFATPEEIADRVHELGCPCCGLTDHGLVSGHLHFTKALTAKGIKPIYGCELYHGLKTSFKPNERDQAHLIALAMTDQGLKNLWSLVNATAQDNHFHYVGRVFWDDLKKFKEGLVVTSACALSLVSKGILNDDYSALNQYLDIFGDQFYIELHTYPYDKPFKDRDSDGEHNMRIINEALVSIAQEKGIGVVYANDAHYAHPNQYAYHDLYIALQTGDTVFTPIEERKMWHPPEALSIMDEASVRKALAYLPASVIDEAIANSVAIGERANASLPKVERHLPMFVPGDCPWLDEREQSLSAEDLFVDLVERGIVEKYGEDASQEVWDRTIYEVETLIRDGIHHYFLMGWDEIQIARDMKISVGPGRGSSAGCIVAYALGITDVDPIHYGLIFERFWNSGRAKGFPDIDTDFSRRRRKELIERLKDRWGADKVCAIGTIGYMKPKATVKKLARGFGISFKDAEELNAIIDGTTKIEILGHDQIGWTRELEPGKVHYVKEDVGRDIERWITDTHNPKHEALRRKFIAMCEICCSRVQQYGVHASGVVISDVPLADELPAYLRGSKDDERVSATMFPMSDVDDRMFIKLDVLGLRTLDVLDYWMELIEEYGIEHINWSGLDKEEHPPEMWDMLTEGYTAAIFQVEDGYGRQLCKSMNPRSVEDLSVLNALNRPGPIQAKIPDAYIARRNGEQKVSFPHPILETILGDTYGLFVFQEQIIAFFNAIGYSLSESDAMRKIMGKKKPEQLNAIRDGEDEWHGKGYFIMAEQAGISYDAAEVIWKTIEGFADYCFNKSHTVAYAIIGFRTLFAKYYGPALAYAASMRSLEPSRDLDKRKELIPVYINECRRLGIEVRPPDIRYAKGYSYVDPNGRLLFGFGDIKGVAHSGDYIAQLRDEMGLEIDTPDLFRSEFARYNEEWAALKKEKVVSGEWSPKVRSPKQLLRANQIDCVERVGAWVDMGAQSMSLTDRQQNESELLGVIITDNSAEVLERNAEQIAACDDYDELLRLWSDKVSVDDDEVEYLQYEVCGIVTGVREMTAKASGNRFGVVTIELGSRTVEFVVWASKWKTHKFLFRLRNVGIFTLLHRPPTEYGEAYHFSKGISLKA